MTNEVNVISPMATVSANRDYVTVSVKRILQIRSCWGKRKGDNNMLIRVRLQWVVADQAEAIGVLLVFFEIEKLTFMHSSFKGRKTGTVKHFFSCSLYLPSTDHAMILTKRELKTENEERIITSQWIKKIHHFDETRTQNWKWREKLNRKQESFKHAQNAKILKRTLIFRPQKTSKNAHRLSLTGDD
jgi:hypothetical protein